jgi:hypothetical protein
MPSALTEAPGHIRLGLTISRPDENVLRRIVFHDLTKIYERHMIGHTRRLFHIMCHDHHAVPPRQVLQQRLDLSGGDRVQSRQGSSKSRISGSSAMARAMHSRCC